MAVKAWRQEWEAAVHIASPVSKQREMAIDTRLAFSFLFGQDLSPWDGATHIRVCLPISVNLTLIFPHRSAHGCSLADFRPCLLHNINHRIGSVYTPPELCLDSLPVSSCTVSLQVRLFCTLLTPLPSPGSAFSLRCSGSSWRCSATSPEALLSLLLLLLLS